ncbi:3D domain-containing protein [Desulfosporosinus burensis]
MYSLPITTYSDYWRRTKQWSSYLGGLAVFAAGTRYSMLEVPEISQLYSLQTLQPLSTKKLNIEQHNTEINNLGLAELAFNRGLIEQRPLSKSTANRGVSDLNLSSQDIDNQAGGTQEISSQALPSEGTGDKEITNRVQVVEQEIPFETQYVESDKLLPGMSQTEEQGEKGVLRQVIKTFEVDGQPVDQQVVSSLELKSPKKEVIIQNSEPIPKKKVIVQTPKQTVAEKEQVDLTTLKISKSLDVEASAYTYTGNNTATGVKPREGLIAVDPKVIPMGTKVYVEGYGYAIAADTGGAILGNKIDVFFGTLRQCMDWGRKPVRIHILNSI